MKEIDWEHTLKDAAIELGNQIMVAIEESADDAWDEISEINKEELKTLSVLMGQLKIREMLGEDVSDLIGHLDAQVANLKFVNKSVGFRVSEAFWRKVLSISGSIIFGVAKKAIGLP